MVQIRKATHPDLPAIWEIMQQGIHRRERDGSSQWQDGYPNPDVLQKDIDREIGYVLEKNGEVAAYAAILENEEPAYRNIKGKWLTNGEFVVLHRVVVGDLFVGHGYSAKLLAFAEELALNRKIPSIKVDTKDDNHAMLAIFKRSGYRYCGEVFLRGQPRMAFEKVLTHSG